MTARALGCVEPLVTDRHTPLQPPVPFLARTPRRRQPKTAGKAEPSPTAGAAPTYTRDVSHRATAILRDHPCSAARPLLPSIPGLARDSHTVARMLKTHPPLQKAFIFFLLAVTASRTFRHDRFTYTSMIQLGEAGRVPAMLGLLAEMLRAVSRPTPPPSPPSCTGSRGLVTSTVPCGCGRR
ncbi:Pentatricopeptide repeat-containing protein [Zea mays]|uniref:Pentatricopeptide repeat-containing protein n=2 Tax=Zea mays TaxID=4577 RepID=K7UZG5_MAIZE|nr:Pentatricopeptide repeat-containing protein [Zea mays]PWZ10962.1 Pentatricopeptide repeat-containing protein [Zea mays]